MKLGPNKIIACPECKALSKYRSYKSRNTIGAMIWTDGKMDAPMHPEILPIARCWNCKSYWWLEEAEEIEDSWLDDDEWEGRKIQRVNPLSAGEYKEALTTGKARNHDQESYLRMRLWWIKNDSIRGKKLKDQLPYSFDENFQALLKLFSGEEESNQLILAEIYRETGSFEQCLEVLDRPFSEHRTDRAIFLRNLAEQKNATVRIFPNKPFLISESEIADYVSDPKTYVHRLFRGKKVRKLLNLKEKELTQAILDEVHRINTERTEEYQKQLRDQSDTKYESFLED